VKATPDKIGPNDDKFKNAMKEFDETDEEDY
jgi:hypothetical protein